MENANGVIRPLVSVGIPTYNRPLELGNILRQMLAQTYDNIEIIVLDNCSTNGDVQRVGQEFAEKYSNVKYIRNAENLGVLRNAAEVTKYPNGKYFCWISDDDHRSRDFIEKTVNHLEQYSEIGCVFCDFKEVDIDGKQKSGYPLNHSKLMWHYSLNSKWLRRVLYYLSSPACGKCNAFFGLFRTEILKEMNYSELSNSYTALDMDCMLVYQTLGITKIPVLEFVGCSLTIGNVKEYEVSPGGKVPGTAHKVANTLIRLNNERRRYTKMSEPIEVILITLLFPVKIFAAFIMLVLGKKCISPFAKYAR